MKFEDFLPIFGEAKAESPSPAGVSGSSPDPYLFHVFASDDSHLRFVATDFRRHSWEAVRSVHQLEDMRDYVGIGGSWSEFMDYVISSLKSDDVKLVLDGNPKSTGAAFAKLVCQKSKGMPLISISLTKLVDSAAGEAMANLSLELFKAFRDVKSLFIKEQERCCQLTQVISAEQEKTETIKGQLDAILFSKKQKLHKSPTDKAKLSYANSDTSSITGLQKKNGEQPTSEVQSVGIPNRAVPAHRRSKVRGIVLQDTEDD